MWPSFNVSAGHQRRTISGTFLTTTHSRTDVQDTFLSQGNAPACRVAMLRITAINNDIASLQQIHQLIDELIDCLASYE